MTISCLEFLYTEKKVTPTTIPTTPKSPKVSRELVRMKPVMSSLGAFTTTIHETPATVMGAKAATLLGCPFSWYSRVPCFAVSIFSA